MVFKDSEFSKINAGVEEVKKSPQKELKKVGRPRKKRLFESSEQSSITSEGDFQKDKQKCFESLKRDDQPFAGILDLNGDMTLFKEILKYIETKKEDFATNFWEGIVMRKANFEKDIKAKSHEELKEVNKILDGIENALKSGDLTRQKSKSHFKNSFFRPIKHASHIFVKNAGLIMTHLLDNDVSIKDVGKLYGVNEKSLQESMRYYLFRCGDRIEKRKRRQKLKLKHNELIAEALQAYLRSRKGMCTTLRMMIDHLKDHFKETITENREEGIKMNMINRARVTKILKEDMEYTWRENCIRDVRADNSRLVAIRKVFPQLLDKLTNLGYNLIYIDECSISPSTISKRSWQKKRQLEPLTRDLRTRINMIAAYIFKGKYAFMLKKGSTRAEHVIRFLELLDKRMEELFTKEYRKNTIFVMDNARVHTCSTVQKFMNHKGFSILMLPAYSPEFNKVEHTFQLLKCKLKKECLFKEPLELVVAQAILNL